MWTSVKDKLPCTPTMCLVFNEDGIGISYFTPKGVFSVDILYGKNTTHWMPLPKPPTNQEK